MSITIEKANEALDHIEKAVEILDGMENFERSSDYLVRARSQIYHVLYGLEEKVIEKYNAAHPEKPLKIV